MATTKTTQPVSARIALLIDADNAPASRIGALLAELAKHGTAIARRIYGDFTSPHLAGWKKVLLDHSIQPMQQFAYTRGKNATDSALIIDAMDLLYSGRFDAFALVSSDSDFTRLAQRLSEAGMKVYGFGEKKTPSPFVRACTRFFHFEVLGDEPEEAEPAPEVPTPAPIAGAKAAKSLGAAVRKLLERAVTESEEDGWAHLGEVGNYLQKLKPDFDPRAYGHRKLSDMVKALPDLFELEKRPGANGGNILYVRLRRKPAAKKR